jgi:hypothetical protein
MIISIFSSYVVCLFLNHLIPVYNGTGIIGISRRLFSLMVGTASLIVGKFIDVTAFILHKTFPNPNNRRI